MPLHQISVIPRDVTTSRGCGSSGKAKDKDKDRDKQVSLLYVSKPVLPHSCDFYSGQMFRKGRTIRTAFNSHALIGVVLQVVLFRALLQVWVFV